MSMNENWLIEKKDWAIVLSLRGEFGLDRVNELSSYINDHMDIHSDESIVIDLKAVDYMDSMALGVLINLYRLFKEKSGSVYLLNPSPTLEKIFKHSGFYNVFGIYKSEALLKKHIELVSQEAESKDEEE